MLALSGLPRRVASVATSGLGLFKGKVFTAGAGISAGAFGRQHWLQALLQVTWLLRASQVFFV
jgi:hypothetical protein